MKLSTSAICKSLLILAALFTFSYLSPEASAQENPSADKKATPSTKFPAAKRQAPETSSADADADFEKALDQEKDEKDQNKAVKADKDGPNAIRKRDEWFYKQRSSANGHIPAGARLQAIQHMQRRMEAEGKLVRRADGSIAEVMPLGAAVTNTWTSIGPAPTTGGFFSPVTGRITTIAIDPSDATGNTVLIGGAMGGIWRSTNAGATSGATWTAVGDQDSSLAMGSIAFAPSSLSTVYAGTGEQASIGFDIYYGAGVLKSTNGGLTWAPTCTTAGPTCPFIGPTSDQTPFGFFTLGGTRISYIAVNPSNPAMVLVGAQTQFLEGPTEGVYCSSDSGNTWHIVATASGEMSTFVGFASSTVAFAALGNPFGSTTGKNGIYKSTNANSCALTFSALTTGLPAESTMGRIDLGISPLFATDNTVYASIADGPNGSSPNLGVWLTTNGGTSWTKTAAPDVCNAQCWYDNVVKVDPNGGAHAFFGGSSASTSTAPLWVVRTANTGASWTSVIPALAGGSAGLPHVDNHAMAFVKLGTKIRMYLGNDGGIWRTDDAEAASVTWTNLNNSPLTLTQFYPALSVHPSSQEVAFAGAQDNGSQIYLGPSLVWTDNNVCGDGTGTAIDNVVPSTVYVACNGINLAVSTQNGQPNTFFTAVNGINPGDNSSFVPPFVTDPSTANTLYVGTTKVYQSVNTGNSWTALSGDLVNGLNQDELTALAVAPGNPKVVYAGADTGQVFVATNVVAGSGAFAQVTGQASLPPRQVSAIAVDPAVATGLTAYAAFSGFAFGADTTGHLFKTADGGATWKDVSCTVASCVTPAASDLPNTPVNDVVVDPDLAGTLYVGTDIGVYQGTCAATCTWSTLSTGLPRVAVLSLKLHHASRTLRAATHGRGVWDIVLNNFTFTGPHISSIAPVSANAGSGSVSLTVNGNGLLGGSVQWNGTTTGVTQGGGSDTSLTATIGGSLTGGAGTPQITVKTATVTSNALTFTVLGAAPTITAVNPTSKPVNSAATQITVTGTGFAANATVLMNPDLGGTAIPTTFVSATQLSATVPASFMAGFGSTNSVGVQNPPPGGGTTVTTQTVTLPTFVVTAPAPVNDNFAGAINITSTAFADTKDSSGATAQAADPLPACSQNVQIPFATGTSNTIWYKVVPTGSGLANIDTIGSSYDSVLTVWSGTSQGALTAVACNDDINPGIITVSQLTNVALNAGTTYFIMVSSFGPADPNPVAFGGKSVLNFSCTCTFGSGTTGTFTVGGTAATVVAGSSGTSTITVTPSGGFTGMVNVTCPAAGLPAGVTCSPNPLAINVTTAAAVTGQLTVAVAAPSTTLTASAAPAERTLYAAGMMPSSSAKGWWMLSAGTGLAAMLLLFLPGRKRYRAALGLGLVCVLSFTLGCGSSSGGGGGGGPIATQTKITVTAPAKVASGAGDTFVFTVSVTGGTPTGQVQLFDGSTALGSAVTVSGGSAPITSNGLSVGTHSITAHYLGTASTQASQSGALNVTVTGTTTFVISTTPASTSGSPTVSITIN
jgi:Bacterial Ig-like domain (group 3)